MLWQNIWMIQEKPNHMKSIQTIFVAAVAGLLLLTTSCKKELDYSIAPKSSTSTKAEKFSDIKTSSSFNWKTTSVISIQVTGLKTEVPIKNTFKVMDKNGNILLQRFMLMSDNLHTTFEAPANIQDFTIQFGSIVKDIHSSNKSIQFDYITPEGV